MSYPKTSYKRFIGPHRFFPQFGALPVEIRTLIWHFTLQPRVIEVDFLQEQGFITTAPVPVCLQVNKETRASVLPFYSLCFGNLVHPPRIRFNFALDTLYLKGTMQPWVLPLLAGMSRTEVASLRRLAVGEDIDDTEYLENYTEYKVIKALETVIPLMKSLQVFQIVYPFDCGYDIARTLQLCTEIPEDHLHDCDAFYDWFGNHCHNDSDDLAEDCNCKFPKEECTYYCEPDIPDPFKGITASKVEVVLAWRGMELRKQY